MIAFPGSGASNSSLDRTARQQRLRVVRTPRLAWIRQATEFVEKPYANSSSQ